MLADQRVGSAELERLADILRPPCRLEDYVLEGVIARTATALVFVARDADDTECVLKLTGRAYSPVLERELRLLNACRAAGIAGLIRPLREELLDVDGAVGIVLPLLAGGDLVQWIGTHAMRSGRLGAAPALEVGEIVAQRLRDLLRLPQPIVHGDVKPQNLLLPRVDAPIAELQLIDLDASTALESPLAAPTRDVAELLISDVHGFGELLYMLATGRDPAPDLAPTPPTGNTAFNTLVVRCMTAEPADRGYASMAGDALWQDLADALAAERRRSRNRAIRPVLAVVGLVLFCLLLVAMLSKIATI